jgi:hypothetical protein
MSWREEIRVYYNKVTYVTGISGRMSQNPKIPTPSFAPPPLFILPGNVKNTRRALDTCARIGEFTAHHNSRNALN